MTSNFLMCLGYVPNDGKETVNFMILERVTVYFFYLMFCYGDNVFLSLSAINMCSVCGKTSPHWMDIHLFFRYRCDCD